MKSSHLNVRIGDERLKCSDDIKRSLFAVDARRVRDSSVFVPFPLVSFSLAAHLVHMFFAVNYRKHKFPESQTGFCNRFSRFSNIVSHTNRDVESRSGGREENNRCLSRGKSLKYGASKQTNILGAGIFKLTIINVDMLKFDPIDFSLFLGMFLHARRSSFVPGPRKKQ